MDQMRIYLWTTDFEQADDNVPLGQEKKYRYLCLACLALEGVVHRTTSPRLLLCRTHAAQFRAWRNTMKGKNHVC